MRPNPPPWPLPLQPCARVHCWPAAAPAEDWGLSTGAGVAHAAAGRVHRCAASRCSAPAPAFAANCCLHVVVAQPSLCRLCCPCTPALACLPAVVRNHPCNTLVREYWRAAEAGARPRVVALLASQLPSKPRTFDRLRQNLRKLCHSLQASVARASAWHLTALLRLPDRGARQVSVLRPRAFNCMLMLPLPSLDPAAPCRPSCCCPPAAGWPSWRRSCTTTASSCTATRSPLARSGWRPCCSSTCWGCGMCCTSLGSTPLAGWSSFQQWEAGRAAAWPTARQARPPGGLQLGGPRLWQQRQLQQVWRQAAASSRARCWPRRRRGVCWLTPARCQPQLTPTPAPQPATAARQRRCADCCRRRSSRLAWAGAPRRQRRQSSQTRCSTTGPRWSFRWSTACGTATRCPAGGTM